MMNILVIGGTKYYGIPMIADLLKKGHNITVATRGNRVNSFGGMVKNICVDRKDEAAIKKALGNKHFDVIVDKVAFVPTDVRKVLDNVTCDKYIQMSSCDVYQNDHEDIDESEFIPCKEPEWVDWAGSYGEAKRLSECAAAYMLGMDRCVLVRYPVVLGKNDYTKRLFFYIEHIIKEQPMYIDNPDHKISYISEDEAGLFLSFLTEHPLTGAVNGCSKGSISVKQILEKICLRTGKEAIITQEGDEAPFNGTIANRTFSTKKAEKAGYSFSDIDMWMDGLIDYYIEEIKKGDGRETDNG